LHSQNYVNLTTVKIYKFLTTLDKHYNGWRQESVK